MLRYISFSAHFRDHFFPHPKDQPANSYGGVDGRGEVKQGEHRVVERTEFRRKALHEGFAVKEAVPGQIIKDGQHPGCRRRGTSPIFRV